MISQILRAKHWLLFTLIYGLPFIVHVSSMGFIMTRMFEDPELGFGTIARYMAVLVVLVAISGGTMMAWFWSVAVGLKDKLPEGAGIPMTRFKAFFIIPLIYFPLAMMLGLSVMQTVLQGQEPDPMFLLKVMPIFMLLHFFTIFCIFHTMFFVAKTIKAAELQRPVTFGDFAGEFFMTWFFFVGVWIMQPKINKMVGGDN